MENINWDFTESDTKYATHGFHTYPAMMVPQIASKLIKEFGKKKKLVYDPYCGTGTTLVEANLAGIDAFGTDLNPLARLISKAKTSIIEPQTLDLLIKDFYDFLFFYRFDFSKKDSIIKPTFQGIDFWFSKNVTTDLAIVKSYIDNIQDIHARDFFLVAFSQTIRECSWTRKNEFKLYKMDAEKIKTFKPDVFNTIERILSRNRKGLLDFIKLKKGESKTSIFNLNTVNENPTKIFHDYPPDLVVSSPPYGDSSTTVAYGQFSRLTNQWLNINEAGKLDSELMGGKRAVKLENFESKILNLDLKKISKIDELRALDVSSFYSDYQDSITNISKSVKKKAIISYVVSNRCVKGVTLQTHKITKDFFEANNFIHKGTYERKISSKRLPRKNSPTGISGEKRTLMNKEYIIVMQKN
ncbi:MAG: DNA methyltransferase [Ferruginibacter sp.]